jgi:hypothetical protein
VFGATAFGGWVALPVTPCERCFNQENRRDFQRLETIFFPSFFRLYARKDQKALTMFGESGRESV